ncbi:alpha/beta fold hydrolase [Bowmanella dokdonensis]|uniref:Alpha/beta hydrolase n=1 Tax=Bowmanella dokdonensis TaxID=751969 RepID=A0A939DNH0_9ALTE|nr:alpha/beta hydrolase [Bowmanella dokdonensis]MBN7825021.1 alpha/beta hydrolase [Bowmanella dokdonensis]
MKEIRLPLRHLTLSGLRFGNPQGPKVLALHGWLDNAASFVPISGYVDHMDIVAVDFAGHGHSEHRSADAHYHLVDWVQDIHELLDSLDWQSCHLLGHSMGGIVSSLYAATFPERIASLVMIEAFGPLSRDEQSSPQQLRESVLSRLEIDSKPARHPPSRKRAVTARMLAGDLGREAASLLADRNLKEEDELKWRTDRRLRTISSLRMTEAQAQAFLQQIRCPVLTIMGSQGFDKIKVNQQQRANLIPQLQIAEAEGGHHVHMDNPHAVAEHIRRFWAQVDQK